MASTKAPADAVQQISLATCFHAVAGTVTGAVRPRRPTRAELASISDSGLPRARGTVRLRVLPHTSRHVPALLAEGTWRPRTLPLAHASYLVEHPQARLLVDPGVCRHARASVIAELSNPLNRAMMPREDPLAVVDALAAVGLDPADIDVALATHLHWDHVSGLHDLPGLGLHIHATEWEWVMRPGPAPAAGVRASVLDRPRYPFELDGPPVLTFPRSHDLLGDGSVTLVDLSGHTPGSVGALLHTEEGWVLLIGDVAWLGRQVTDARQKAAFPGLLVDVDPDATWITLLRVRAVADRVLVVPAHDPTCLGAEPAAGLGGFGEAPS